MRKFPATAMVVVASLVTVVPAMANPANIGFSLLAASESAYYDGLTEPSYGSYWIEQSAYYSAGRARTDANDHRPVRHVMISGYHPVDGFGPEARAEQAALTVYN